MDQELIYGHTDKNREDSESRMNSFYNTSTDTHTKAVCGWDKRHNATFTCVKGQPGAWPSCF